MGIASATLLADSSRFRTRILLGGIAIVLCYVMPITVAPNGEFFWIWSMFSEMPPMFQVSVVLGGLIGIAMIVLSVATTGLGRSISIMSIFTLNQLSGLVLFTTQAQPRGPGSEYILPIIWAIWLGVISYCVLVAAAQWRALGPTVARRTIVCVAGSIFTVVCLTALLIITGGLIEEGMPRVPSSLEVAVVIAIVLFFASLALGLAGGILGIVLVNPSASGSVARTSASLTRFVPVLLFALIGAIACVDVYQSAERADMQWLFPIVLVVLWACLMPLFVLSAFVAGIRELMLSCSAAIERRGSPPPSPAPQFPTGQGTPPAPIDPFP